MVELDLTDVSGLLNDFAEAIGLRKRDEKLEAKKACPLRPTFQISEASSDKSLSNHSQTSKLKTPVKEVQISNEGSCRSLNPQIFKKSSPLPITTERMKENSCQKMSSRVSIV